MKHQSSITFGSVGELKMEEIHYERGHRSLDSGVPLECDITAPDVPVGQKFSLADHNGVRRDYVVTKSTPCITHPDSARPWLTAPGSHVEIDPVP